MKTILMLFTAFAGEPTMTPIAEYEVGAVESCIADAEFLMRGYADAYCVPADDLKAKPYFVACAFADKYPTDMNVEYCDMLSEGRHYAKYRK